MVRRRSPVVEGLEVRALLSSLSYSLTTDQSVYQLGQPITMTFAATNATDQPLTVPWGPPAGFTVTHDGAAVMLDALPPAGISGGTPTFQPGQTITVPQTWNGIPMAGPYTLANLTGSFVAEYGPQDDPAEFTTTFQIAAPSSYDLVTGVTTDQTAYQPGQPVNLTFTETNDGNQPVAIVTGAPGFEITQNGAPVWSSASADTPMVWPTWSTLQPGQSSSQMATWNGLPTTGPLNSLAAPFTVSNDLDPNADLTTFQYVAPSTDVLSTSLTSDQSVYQPGQPIQLTFTETNVGSTTIQVLEGPSSFDVKENDAGVIWNSLFPDYFPDPWAQAPQSYTWVTLQPGQSFTQTATWNGVPDQLPSNGLSGTFSASNELDPRGETASFEIVAPTTNLLTTSVTSDQPTYDFGEPAQFIFTETDTGNQPVAVLTGPAAFDLTQNGTVRWASIDANDLPSSTSWETLQPGQSYTQTNTWDGIDGLVVNNPQATGTFTVSNLLDPNASSTTIQILSTPYPPPIEPGPIGVPIAPPPQPPNWPLSTIQIPSPSYPPPSTPNPQPPNSMTSPTNVTATLSAQHAAYTVGHSVPITLVLTNLSTNKIAVKHRHAVETVTVQLGSTLVYESARKVHAVASEMIKPGHPLKLTALWPGKANQVGVKKLTPGRYTITLDDDGYAASTTVDLGRSRHSPYDKVRQVSQH